MMKRASLGGNTAGDQFESARLVGTFANVNPPHLGSDPVNENMPPIIDDDGRITGRNRSTIPVPGGLPKLVAGTIRPAYARLGERRGINETGQKGAGERSQEFFGNHG
jgi:hypothetical protein